MSQTPPPPHAAPPRPVLWSGAVERLYAYWIISTALLAFALIVTTFYVRATLRELTERISSLEHALIEISDLDDAIAAPLYVEPELPAAEPAAPTVAEEIPPAPEVQVPPAPPVAEAELPPITAETPVPPAPTSPALPTDAELAERLARVLTPTTLCPLAVTDADAGADLLQLAYQQADHAVWSGANWSRLAIVARLLSRAAAAELFARRAFQAGDPLREYAEISARVLLAQGRTQEALVHARHFAEQSDGAPAAQVLLARAWLALDHPATADETLQSLTDPAGLATYDQLALARVALGLHDWNRLAVVMTHIETVPVELEAERSFLWAVTLIQKRDRLVEALGILDYLAEHATRHGAPAEDRLPAHTSPATTPLSSPVAPSLCRSAAPSLYEVATWRGVALSRGQQWEAARTALEAAAAMSADRPDAHYWRGLLELQAGQPAAAQVHLQNALAASPTFAPAWEALASAALNADDVEGALQYAEKAISANRRRAPAHFLRALAHAKASRPEPAAAALVEALRLDRQLLEEARQADVLARLFAPEELEELAQAATAEPAPAEETLPPP